MMKASISMDSLALQDVTHQLVQHFIAELQDMLDDLGAGTLSPQQSNVLDKIVVFFDQEMKDHHREEEGHVFPLLLSQGNPALSEKVRVLQADHDELRIGWRKLKSCIQQAQTASPVDAQALHTSFDQYSTCFARHLALEESIQFSPETQLLFKRWDT